MGEGEGGEEGEEGEEEEECGGGGGGVRRCRKRRRPHLQGPKYGNCHPGGCVDPGSHKGGPHLPRVTKGSEMGRADQWRARIRAGRTSATEMVPTPRESYLPRVTKGSEMGRADQGR